MKKLGLGRTIKNKAGKKEANTFANNFGFFVNESKPRPKIFRKIEILKFDDLNYDFFQKETQKLVTIKERSLRQLAEEKYGTRGVNMDTYVKFPSHKPYAIARIQQIEFLKT